MLLLGVPLVAKVIQPVAPDDPFLLPKDAKVFANHAVDGANSSQVSRKLQALLRVIFAPPADGGMGLKYDNAYTRTVAEVWQDKKANCLSMTAFFVAAARASGIHTDYAEALNTSHWRRVGNLIEYEHHGVALSALDDLVVDFVPQMRKRVGHYVVTPLTEKRFRSLFFSNRAVEALRVGDMDEAQILAQVALNADPRCCIGWNLMGVVAEAQGQPAQAEEAFHRALSLDPRDGAPVGNLERLLRAAGRTQEAEDYRKQGEDVRRKDPYYHADLAEQALADGDLAEAEKRIKLALGLQPREPEFFLLQGKLKVAQGRWDEAIQAIRKARKECDPDQQAALDAQLARVEGLRVGKGVEPPVS